jgi:hypothetical protein
MAVRTAASAIAVVLLWGTPADAGQSAAKAGYAAGVALVFAVATPIAGTTGSDGDYDREGFYLGGGAALAFNTFESEVEDALGSDASVDDSFGASAQVGYRLHPHVSSEVEFEWLSGFDVSTSGEKVANLETWALTGNVKGHLLTGSIQPFALVGLGVLNVLGADAAGLGLSDWTTGVALRFGGGLDLYLSRRFGMNISLDYMYPTGDVKDFDYLSLGIGLQYRF